MPNRSGSWIASIIALVALLSVVLFIVNSRSAAYKFAGDYVGSSPPIAQSLGADVHIVLPMSFHQEVTNFTDQWGHHSSQGSASFLLLVKGHDRFGLVILELTMRDDAWSVSIGNLYTWGHQIRLAAKTRDTDFVLLGS